MNHLFGEIQSLHGFVKKSGGKIRAQLIFLGLFVQATFKSLLQYRMSNLTKPVNMFMMKK